MLRVACVACWFMRLVFIVFLVFVLLPIFVWFRCGLVMLFCYD